MSVPEASISQQVTPTTTSKRQLSILTQQAQKELGLAVAFLVVRDSRQQQMEAGLNALLQTKFPNAHIAAFLSARSAKQFDVWLDSSAEAVETDQFEAAKKHIKEYLALLEAKPAVIRLVSQESTAPGPANIVREIKRLAPVSISDLSAALARSGFLVPSPSWLALKLDSLRRKGLIVRLATGNHVLSEMGLNLVPHSKSRHSSDVERALALGRSKWH